ncbi:MAG: ABC transporter ATP-binding protein [Ruminococcaceae bacterium]|nr:ABC transporter ATP-binding protein [Oscillospiraceae bacterium]
MEKIISVEHLSKSYGDVKAVDDISFYAEKGKLFAFLGTNGAGKSTTIDILCTLLQPDSGTVTIDGHILGKDDDSIRGSIGVVFQKSLLDDMLTVRENLTMRGRFYGLSGRQLKEAVEKAARTVGADEFIDRRYGKLSGGQRRRADIARALLNTPKILFLDEPTTGLDPKTRREVWETVSRLQQSSDMTVFLTTHYLEEAAEADYVIIIDKGSIVAKGTPDALREEHSSDLLRILPARRDELLSALDAAGHTYEEKSGVILLRINSAMDALPILNSLGDRVETFEVIHGTLDDVFLNITGKELQDA